MSSDGMGLMGTIADVRGVSIICCIMCGQDQSIALKPESYTGVLSCDVHMVAYAFIIC